VETIHRGNWHSSGYPIEEGNCLYTLATWYPMEEAAECNGKKRSSLSVAGSRWAWTKINHESAKFQKL